MGGLLSRTERRKGAGTFGDPTVEGVATGDAIFGVEDDVVVVCVPCGGSSRGGGSEDGGAGVVDTGDEGSAGVDAAETGARAEFSTETVVGLSLTWSKCLRKLRPSSSVTKQDD